MRTAVPPAPGSRRTRVVADRRGRSGGGIAVNGGRHQLAGIVCGHRTDPSGLERGVTGWETSADTRVGCTAPVRRLLRVIASTRTGTAAGPDALRNAATRRAVAAGTKQHARANQRCAEHPAAHHGLVALIPIPQAIRNPAARARMILPARGVTMTPCSVTCGAAIILPFGYPSWLGRIPRSLMSVKACGPRPPSGGTRGGPGAANGTVDPDIGPGRRRSRRCTCGEIFSVGKLTDSMWRLLGSQSTRNQSKVAVADRRGERQSAWAEGVSEADVAETARALDMGEKKDLAKFWRWSARCPTGHWICVPSTSSCRAHCACSRAMWWRWRPVRARRFRVRSRPSDTCCPGVVCMSSPSTTTSPPATPSGWGRCSTPSASA